MERLYTGLRRVPKTTIWVFVVIAVCLAWSTMENTNWTIDASVLELSDLFSVQPPRRRLNLLKDGASIFNDTESKIEKTGGLNTTWTTLVINVSLPVSIDSGFSSICNPQAEEFMLNNNLKPASNKLSPLERAHVQTYTLASVIGFLKVAWMVFQLALPFLFPPQLPVKKIREWKLEGEHDEYARVMDWKKKQTDNEDKNVEENEPPPSETFIHHFGWKNQSWKTALKDQQKSEKEWEWGNVTAPFYDPSDYHKTCRLDQMIPSRNHFDVGMAERYFAARMQEPATKAKLVLPWSQRTQLLLYFGQCVRGAMTILKSVTLGPPHFWMLYTHEWFALTFRPELFLFRLYLYVLLFALASNLLVFDEDVAWVGGGLMFLVLSIFSIPFLPAVACVVLPPAVCGWLYIELFDEKQIKLGFCLDSFLAILLVLGCFTWPFMVGFLSKKVFSVSRDTYLCPMSHMNLVTMAPDSVAGFFVTLVMVTAGLMMIVAIASWFLTSEYGKQHVLSPNWMMRQWLRNSFEDEKEFKCQDNHFSGKKSKQEKEEEKRGERRANHLKRRQIECARKGHELVAFDPSDLKKPWYCAGCLKKEKVRWWRGLMRMPVPKAAGKTMMCLTCTPQKKRYCPNCSKVMIQYQKNVDQAKKRDEQRKEHEAADSRKRKVPKAIAETDKKEEQRNLPGSAARAKGGKKKTTVPDLEKGLLESAQDQLLND